MRLYPVHQGDWDRLKVLYQLSALEEGAQGRDIFTVEREFLLRAREALLKTFHDALGNSQSRRGQALSLPRSPPGSAGMPPALLKRHVDPPQPAAFISAPEVSRGLEGAVLLSTAGAHSSFFSDQGH